MLDYHSQITLPMTVNSEKYLKIHLNKHIPYIKCLKFDNIKIQ